jgi:peptide/nickel transport system substrate-binding protein
MTVDDVVGSIQRLTSPDHKNSWQGQFGAVDSVVASGPSQVTITTKTPRVALPAALAGPPASILAMKELNAGTFDPAKQTLGTGPFVVDSHTNNESWTFVRNPYYWRQGLPKADKVIVQIIPDENARLASLRNGTVGACFFERLDSGRLLEGVPNVKTVVQNNASIWYLAVNNSPSSIFQDIRLRQAVALAVDRDKIIKVALNGVGTPSAVVPTPFNVCDPKAVPFGTPDLNQARQLVQQAGATGKNISIIAGTFDANHSPIAQVLQQDLKAIGFGDVSILPLEAGVMVDRVYTGNKADFDLIVNSTSGYGDPAAMVSLWFNPEAAVIDKAWLPPDSDMLSLITKIGSTPLGQPRNDLLVDACKRAAQGANWIPLVTKARIIGFRSDLVAPRVQPLETYADPLRHLAEYAVLK